ncbi:MAG: acetoacetate--CoA ligase [Proteobacteria bacterium]|nr:acetoacetate--CoA ligase [Pseudomonadota bacterium]
MGTPLWTPSPERVANANVTAFREAAAAEWGVELADYAALYRWSVDRPEQFWPSVWRFGGIIASRQWTEALTGGERMPGARWFTGARLNFAENLLRRRDDVTAIVSWGETRVLRRLSFAEVHDQTARLARALKADGVGPGDRVAGYMPNVPETVIAMLAAASIGAIWSSCSPDFGLGGVIDRFGQIGPKVLFAADGYVYNGKRIDSLERVAGMLDQIPGIERVVIAPHVADAPDLGRLEGAVEFADYLGDGPGGEIEFEQLPFDHPLCILYTSGTTGAPKCIVHGAGGTLIQHLKEHQLHVGLKPDDRLFYFTTCGWMMWNWLASGLASGATIVLYDGSPFHPDGNVLFDLAAEHGVTVFGASAKYLAGIEKAGLKPGETHDLSRIETILSTGSTLAPESFDFVYDHIKRDVCLASISGGTDIMGCFALGNPAAPVWRGELQTRALGMKVEVFDDDGRALKREKGELVCTKPFPSMPIGFWNDPGDARYRAAYFERFPGVWCHGDYVEITGHDGLIIHGRSDAVLNPGGVRIGTAEIYRQVEKIDEVVEAICVGQNWEGDVRVVLFVVLRPGLELDNGLIERIRREVRAGASPRHVPAKIIQVADIPRTISGKIVELAVRDVIHGRPVGNTDALANPEALDFYKDLPELRA